MPDLSVTPGQLMFYGGAALLAFTLVLGILFLIKKPVYRPENEAVQIQADAFAQRLRNGGPTAPVTIWRDTAPQPGPVYSGQAVPPAQAAVYITEETKYLPEDGE